MGLRLGGLRNLSRISGLGREGSVNLRTGAAVAPVHFPRSDGKHAVESLRLRSRMRVIAGNRTRLPPSLGRGLGLGRSRGGICAHSPNFGSIITFESTQLTESRTEADIYKWHHTDPETWFRPRRSLLARIRPALDARASTARGKSWQYTPYGLHR